MADVVCLQFAVLAGPYLAQLSLATGGDNGIAFLG